MSAASFSRRSPRLLLTLPPIPAASVLSCVCTLKIASTLGFLGERRPPTDASSAVTRSIARAFLRLLRPQIHFLNLGLARGDATLVVPTYYVSWTFFGTLGGKPRCRDSERLRKREPGRNPAVRAVLSIQQGRRACAPGTKKRRSTLSTVFPTRSCSLSKHA